MSRLGRVWDRTIRVVAWGSAVAIFVMLALVVTEVILRKFFNFSIVGTVEIVAALMVVIVFLAWSYTESQKGHVRVEFVVARLGHNTQLVLEIAFTLVMLGMFTLVIWQTMVYAFDVWRPARTYETSGIPIFPFRVIVSVGVFFFSLQLLIKLVSLVTRLLPLSRKQLSNMSGKEEQPAETGAEMGEPHVSEL